jgi:chromosome segregation ATPase
VKRPDTIKRLTQERADLEAKLYEARVLRGQTIRELAAAQAEIGQGMAREERLHADMKRVCDELFEATKAGNEWLAQLREVTAKADELSEASRELLVARHDAQDETERADRERYRADAAERQVERLIVIAEALAKRMDP